MNSTRIFSCFKIALKGSFCAQLVFLQNQVEWVDLIGCGQWKFSFDVLRLGS